jgi:hypothetical protein
MQAVKVFAFCLLCVLAVFLSSCSDQKQKKQQQAAKNYARVQRLVNKGQDIEQAIRALKEQDFKVGEKYKPTESGQYYQVNVALRNNVSSDEFKQYAFGGDADAPIFAVIKADLSGKITSVRKQ